LKELILLETLEKNKNITQKELAEHVNVAPSMINQYIKNLEEKQYLYKDIKSSRVIKYMITDKGIERKQYLLMTYMYELLAMYNLAKENFEEVFERLEARGCTRLLLYGAGEVAETIIGLIHGRYNSRLEIKAIMDDNEGKQGSTLFGYKIVNPKDIKFQPDELVLITSYSYEQQIQNNLRTLNFPAHNVVSLFRDAM